MTAPAPAGWYPDPSGASGQRWWDGAAWSTAVSPAIPSPVATAAMPSSTMPAASMTPSPYIYPPTGYQGTAHAQGGNRFALITFGVVALYMIIAFETNFVIFGFLPLGLSIRSQRQREPLAPFAIAAAVLAIVVAAVRIFGH
jgi:hypothetical protein